MVKVIGHAWCIKDKFRLVEVFQDLFVVVPVDEASLSKGPKGVESRAIVAVCPGYCEIRQQTSVALSRLVNGRVCHESQFGSRHFLIA